MSIALMSKDKSIFDWSKICEEIKDIFKVRRKFSQTFVPLAKTHLQADPACVDHRVIWNAFFIVLYILYTCNFGCRVFLDVNIMFCHVLGVNIYFF